MDFSKIIKKAVQSTGEAITGGTGTNDSKKLAADTVSANAKLFTKKQKAKMRSGQRSLMTNDPSQPVSNDTLGAGGI